MQMPATYDPELPFFYELRQTLVTQAERDVAVERRRNARRRQQRTLPVMRFTRRTAVLAALLVAIAATAWGASTIVQAPPAPAPGTGVAPSSETLLLRHGEFAGERWTMRVWMAGPQICSELVVAEVENSSCAAMPAGRQIRWLSLHSPLNRYVFGVTGARLRSVSVHLSGSSRRALTHALARSRARWFIVGAVRPAGNALPRARVTAP